MNVSVFWNFENNKGEIIVHNKTNKITSYLSPSESIKSFEEWSKKSLEFIKVN